MGKSRVSRCSHWSAVSRKGRPTEREAFSRFEKKEEEQKRSDSKPQANSASR